MPNKIRGFDVARTVYEALSYWVTYENTSVVEVVYEPSGVSRRTATLGVTLADGRTAHVTVRIDAPMPDKHDDDEDGDAGGATVTPIGVR